MKKYDVIVVGGGFAGTVSAISIARNGLSVLLVEKYNCLGGAACYNLVNPFMPYWTYDKSGNKIELSKGLFKEITTRLEKENGLARQDKCCFNEEVLKHVLNKMAIESGVNLLFQTLVTGVLKKEGNINGITISNVAGNQEIFADYFIDATGDANLSFMSGYPYQLGRKEDNLCQPMTLCFRLGNVHVKDMGIFEKVNKLYKKYKSEGKINNPREDILVFKTPMEGIYHFNTTRVVKLNPTDGFDVTKAEIIARDQVFEIYDFLKSNFEEFSDSQIISTGIQIGVRESRMIEGEHLLTKEEMLAFTHFNDGIAACNYDIDIHSPDGSGTSHYYFPKGKFFTIPYGCLVPKGSKNLLVAGRCISATHEAQASIRIMPVCCSIGEAAGIAVSQACKLKKSVNDIDINKVRSLLINNGAFID